MEKSYSVLECPFHKFFIVPLVDIFTFGIYGGVCNMTRIENRFQENLSKVKDGMEQPAGKSDK